MRNNKWEIQGYCEDHILDAFETLAKEFNIPKEAWTEAAQDCFNQVETEIEDLEAEYELEDFDEEDMVDYLEGNGYLVIKAPSLNERYKLEAFKERLKRDPYGPMFIL